MQSPALFGEGGNNKQNTYAHVRNADATTILRGSPAIYAMSGTNDAYAVIQSSTAGPNKSTAYFAGIAAQDIAPGDTGMVIISGVAPFVRCSASIATPDTSLTVNPAANNFVAGATVAAIIAIATVGPSALPPIIAVAGTSTVDGVANVARALLRAG